MRPLFAFFSAKAALTVAAMIVGFEPVNAVPLDMPVGPQSANQHVKFETPTLPPMAYTMFCQRDLPPNFHPAAIRVSVFCTPCGAAAFEGCDARIGRSMVIVVSARDERGLQA
jgi:hypothetical protein